MVGRFDRAGPITNGPGSRCRTSTSESSRKIRARRRAPVAPPTGGERERNHVAVKLRLMRMGKKKQPTYRIVAADSRSPRDGRFIEIVGTYEPRADPSVVKIDREKA